MLFYFISLLLNTTYAIITQTSPNIKEIAKLKKNDELYKIGEENANVIGLLAELDMNEPPKYLNKSTLQNGQYVYQEEVENNKLKILEKK